MYVCVCVCMCERERTCVCVCMREGTCVCVREGIYLTASVCVKGESRGGEKSTFVRFDHYAAAEAKCKTCFTSDGLKCYSFNISCT